MNALRAWLPRSLRRWIRRQLRAPLYAGDYPTWAAALRDSRGYDDVTITEKVVAAARAVRDGQAAWERDTVLFHTPAKNEPVFAALRQAAAANHGRLHVVDFGGALGSTWWQHRAWLGDIAEVRWWIVEQPALVVAGRREFTIEPLRFFESLAAAASAGAPDTLVLSGVLSYLESPHAMLAEARQLGFRRLIIDRTGFVARGRDRLTVQHVPPSIYDASYPSWFFARGPFLQAFAGWRVTAEWVNNDDIDIDAEHRGLVLERP
jgi:putative methyltransferase (TIGR04325 family)